MADQITVTPRTTLEPFSPSYVRDPYPTFRRLRLEDPVWFAEDLGVWVVSRYDDVLRVLADHETYSNAMTLAPVMPICRHAGGILAGLDVDPVTAAGDGPSHARTRKALMATFPSTPRRAAACEPMIARCVDDLLSRMTTRADADLVRDFTWELPVRVILTLLGVPPEDFRQIKAWSDGQIALIWGAPSDVEQVHLASDLVNFWTYCRELVVDRAASQGDDLISTLLDHRAGDDGVLTEREIASIAFNLLVAGHETTSNMLSNGAYHLLAGSGWSEIVADPARIPAAVEEMLRFDPPIVGWLRATRRAVTLGGADIPAEERLLLLLGSANRDGTRFSHAEEFDIARPNAADHLSFGHGRHFCVGAALSRAEARIAFESLTARLPRLCLLDGFEPSYVPNVGFRALQSLPVTWR